MEDFFGDPHFEMDEFLGTQLGHVEELVASDDLVLVFAEGMEYFELFRESLVHYAYTEKHRLEI